MANIKSQKKRILTNEKRRVRNKDVSTALKTQIKQFHQALESDDSEAAKMALRGASRQLDRAASKGVIHSNNAANRKSSMARMLNTRTS
ncbi:MAG: 30S ribosomal protein S20 [Actinomycetota bacterium]